MRKVGVLGYLVSSGYAYRQAKKQVSIEYKAVASFVSFRRWFRLSRRTRFANEKKETKSEIRGIDVSEMV